jgi:hypothetical protein
MIATQTVQSLIASGVWIIAIAIVLAGYLAGRR